MVFALDYGSCHVARNTLVMIVANNVQTIRWPATSLDLNHIIGPIETRFMHSHLQLNHREHTRVIHQMCAAILQLYIHRHNLSMRTRYLVVDGTPGGCTKY